MQSTHLQGAHLSYQQLRQWSLFQQGYTNHIECALLLEGNLNRGILQCALENLVDRHEILRTVFYSLPGMDVPMQVIKQHVSIVCPLVDLEGSGVSDWQSLLKDHYLALQEENFDLKHGPLLRSILLRATEYTYVLLFSMPALCADVTTLKYFTNELQLVYSSLLRGQEFLDEPLQYVDVSAWLQNFLPNENSKQQREFWQRFDLSQLSTMRLPFEYGKDIAYAEQDPQSHAAFAPAQFVVPVSSVVSAKIQKIAQHYQVSTEVFLLTCWQVVLWRLTGVSPDLLGVACNGRHYEDLVGVLGPYTRYVPLKCSVDEHLSFEHVLSITNAAFNDIIQKQEYFTWEASSSGQKPLFFPTSFEYEVWPTPLSTGDISISFFCQCSCAEPFALKLSAIETHDALHLEMHYNAARLSSTYIQRIAHVFHTVVLHVLAQPQLLLGNFPLLTLDEQQQLQDVLSGSEERTEERMLTQRFEAQVEIRPLQPAVICGSNQLTYQYLNQQANQLAHLLQKRKVGPNVLVGLCIDRSVQMFIGMLAVLKAGGTYVPLDPDQPAARLLYQLKELGSGLVLTQERIAERLLQWEGHALYLDAADVPWSLESDVNLGLCNDPDDLAYVIYTSGSTGQPKGVMIRHTSVNNYVQSLGQLLAAEPGLHFATVSTLAADLGNTAIFCALTSGGTLHVLPYETLTSGDAFARYVAEHPIDVLKIVPSHLAALFAAAPGQAILPRRHLVLGGEAFPLTLLARIREQGADCVVINHYGPTETTIGAIINVLGKEDIPMSPVTPVAERGTIPIGRPITNLNAYIVDPFMQLVPQGMVGELYLAGVGLASGYLNQPEQTAERFVPHPYSRDEGACMYRTGDLVRMTEQGLIQFVGRTDTQVKVNGYRIELGEIETILSQHDNVREVVVLLRMGKSGEAQVVAYVVPRQQPAPTRQALRGFLEGHVPGYMIPTAMVFLRTLPLNANGKIDRHMLVTVQESQLQQKLLVLDQPSEPTEQLQPRDEVELRLLTIWEEVLNRRPLTILENFFDIGGHSILAVRLMSLIHKLFGQDLPFTTLFQYPTVAELAVILRQRHTLPKDDTILVKLQPDGTKLPFFCVHPAGGNVFCYSNLMRYLGSDQPFYGLSSPHFTASDESLSRLEDIASLYITALQTVQPQGPYLVGGWSLGGVIAFEMAQQLQQQGIEVALLAIIDSEAPKLSFSSSIDEAPVEPDLSDAELAHDAFIAFDIEQDTDFVLRGPEEQLMYTWQQAIIAKAIPEDTSFALFRRIMFIRRIQLQAAYAYVPRVYPNRITFFRASESVKGEENVLHLKGDDLLKENVAGGWEKLAAGGLEVNLVPGNHKLIVEEPGVQELARLLGESIARVSLNT